MNPEELRSRLDTLEKSQRVGAGELSVGTGALVVLALIWLLTEYGHSELRRRGG